MSVSFSPSWIEGSFVVATVSAVFVYLRGKFAREQKRDEVDGSLDERAHDAVKAAQERTKQVQDQLVASESRNVALQIQLGEAHQRFATFAIEHSARMSADLNGMREGLNKRMDEMREAHFREIRAIEEKHDNSMSNIANEHTQCRTELTALRMAMAQVGINIPQTTRS